MIIKTPRPARCKVKLLKDNIKHMWWEVGNETDKKESFGRL